MCESFQWNRIDLEGVPPDTGGWGRHHAGIIRRGTSSGSSILLVPTTNREGRAAKDPWKNAGDDKTTVKPRQHQSSKSFPAPSLLFSPSQFGGSQRAQGMWEETEAPGEERATQQSCTPSHSRSCPDATKLGEEEIFISNGDWWVWVLTWMWTYWLLNGD